MQEQKVKLWMPVTKDPDTGEYLAALSDTSLDRDEEAMGKELIINWGKYKSLKALANHDNKMQSWVGGWNDLKAIEKGNNAALFAKPWFFSKEANPLAHQIKKQVDEALAKGEKPGISVGAIVHASEMRKINGKEVRVFTEGELVEATWVPIQSNRNATYGHIAKQFGVSQKPHTEDTKMDKEFTQKDIDVAIQKKLDEQKIEFDKQLKDKETELSKAQEEITTKDEEIVNAKKALETSEKEAKVKIDKAEAEAEKQKKSALEKQQFADQSGKQKVTAEEVDKAFGSGKLPVMFN